MADKKVLKSFMWGALTGAVTGAVSALLFAPKSGKELRKDISATAQKVGGKTAEVGRQAGAAVQTLAKRTSEFASDAKHAAGRFVTDIRSRKGIAEPEAGETESDERPGAEDHSAVR
ncbi:YtxH domain-containing protein [Cohnella sp. CFH 77786]|uniref:YtxH domain-containing protein n=1 Tax=Cohnella sp. CFH 77786 TaxID=2662265 RepID=UPI001C60AE92|nr:YtxH domain-containing protein [Cohnella sp. CFH 77786]MBW5445032.1 YtxH domain-containing protein [Cohnella sp. CFH 77786]